MGLLDDVKKELRPDSLILKDVDFFVVQINSMLKKCKLKAVCVKGGSVAKGTFLKNDYDVDLFVKFDYKTYKDEDISKLLQNALKNIPFEVIHGSRDYLHHVIGKITYEIVPVLEVKNTKDSLNVTDMSPLHVDWVKKRLKKGMEDEIRLTKQFCKSAKVYGAESYINGFSGHVIDILIIHYGGFEKLLKAATKWKAKVVIDTEKAHKNPLFELNKSKTQGPLIIVDPLLSSRNAAAAVSEEKFDLFIKTAKSYLKKPSKEYFIIKEFDSEQIKKDYKKNKIILLTLDVDSGKTDVVGAKILKTYEYLITQLVKNEFKIIFSDWKWNKNKKAEIIFVLDPKKLSKELIKTGPPIEKKDACKDFKKKYENIYEKDKRLFAKTDRAHLNPESLIKQIILNDYVKEKTKKITMKTL